MTKKKETALAKTEGGVLAHVDNVQDALAAMQDNLAGQPLSPSDLVRVKMPTGGGQHWMVETLASPDGEPTKTISGVIIHVQASRAYWSEDYGSGSNEPDCSSPDAKIGYGDPGGPCAECPHQKFGSGRGNSQACTLRLSLFILREGDMLPIIINLSPGSLANYRRFAQQLGTTHHSNIEVEVGLEKKKSGDGFEYSAATFTLVRELGDDESTKVQQYRAALLASLTGQRSGS